nr:PREDICTED: fatty acyl-CoA reductase 1-like [Bemisia tabaci]XP_018917265.1 PREDICTED: fatty acyl-CoA reductase 1-like [Bemisia tabaci]XP_018917266.1 PREDICTED: fatty acyl-CoA reductase 1-like [Bemisia tabaci]
MASQSESCESVIQEFYKGKNVLITGATGFMGKVLVEKLVRSCPETRISLILRPKNGQSIDQRLDRFKAHKVFDRVREENLESRLLNIDALEGDLLEPELGLNEQDKKRLAKTHIVFHCAASVEFNQPIREAVLRNAGAILEFMKIAKKMTNLKAFVHVSTAYSNANIFKIDEIVYKNKLDYKTLLSVVKNDSSQTLGAVESKVIEELPNTYVFSKALGEQVIADHEQILPVTIFRPSIVTAAIAEPVPGWVDVMNGITWMMVGGATGVVRVLPVDSDKKANFIPVDTSINAMIACAWDVSRSIDRGFGRRLVYNCAVDRTSEASYGDVMHSAEEYYNFPFLETFWYPNGMFIKNKTLCFFYSIFVHLIPALLADAVALSLKKEPRLLAIQRKIYFGVTVFEYFLRHEWKFNNQNLHCLWDELGAADKQLFNFDLNQLVDFRTYLRIWISGGRKYVMKLTEDSIPAAKKRLMRLYYLDWVAKSIGACVLLFFTLAFVKMPDSWLPSRIVDNFHEFEYFFLPEMRNVTMFWGRTA